MLTYPQTRRDAERYVYGNSSLASESVRYDSALCAAEVGTSGRLTIYHQRNNKPGHGPAGLYCRRHAHRALAQSKSVRHSTWFYWGRLDTPGDIGEVKVLAHTTKTVTLASGHTVKIESEYGRYFPDRESAVAHAMTRLRERLAYARREVHELIAAIQKFRKQTR